MAISFFIGIFIYLITNKNEEENRYPLPMYYLKIKNNFIKIYYKFYLDTYVVQFAIQAKFLITSL